MDEYDPHISIGEVTKARDCNYITKEVCIENTIGKVETPFKVFDVTKFDLKYCEDYINTSKEILESIKYINQYKTYNSLYNILEEPKNNQKQQLNQLFKTNNKWKSFNSTISLSFSRNPFEKNKFKRGISKPIKFSSYEYLLDYLHEFSTTFIIVPDINFKSFNSFKKYKEYVENAVHTFSTLNNKAIFVPVPTKMNTKQMDELMEFYRSKNYSNLWFNFNSTQINTQISKIRFLFRRIEEYFGNNAVIYFSHIKKEINRNLGDIYTKPSDALSPFFGCDLLGANRESGFGSNKQEKMTPKEKIEYETKKKLNQNRIFDPSSYYYYNLDRYPNLLPVDMKKILSTKGMSDILNSHILNEEIKKTRNHIEENKNIKLYINEKRMFLNEKKLINEILINPLNQSDLLDFIKGI